MYLAAIYFLISLMSVIKMKLIYYNDREHLYHIYQLTIICFQTKFPGLNIICMSQTDLKCPKHGQNIVYICSMQTCKQHRLICEICQQKQTLHFYHHANYIYKYKQLKQFNNGKTTIPRLEKGIQDCENSITVHKKFYHQQILLIKEDFALIKEQFSKIADNFQNIYLQGFQRELEKFDQEIDKIKHTFKDYVNEKNHESSFFTNLFDRKKDDNDIESLVNKNTKAFQVRAQIITLKQTLNTANINKIRYKATENEAKVFNDLRQYLVQFSNNFFDKFKELLESNIQSQNLRTSIVSQTKSLAMSQVSLGTPFEQIGKNSTSFTAEKTFKKVELPELNLIVKSVREKLKPLEIPPNYNISKGKEGPYLYSAGVYLGQYENWKRQGWGIFIFTDGCIYEGFWENDTMSGYGRLIKKNCYYEGQIKDGKAHGSGNYEDEFRTYAGEWKNDKRSGLGEQSYKSKKKRYIGQFIHDKYEGKGKLVNEDYVYEGKFKNGVFDGKGKISYNNQELYEGQFSEGNKILGKHVYPDGSYYDGNFKNNLPEGTGQFFWADGLKYVGQWKNGYQEGIGSQVHLDGKQLKGIWKGGQWQKWL